MNKKVIVTGASGQDGSLMIKYLLENTDYEILGATRRTSQPILKNLQNAINNKRFRLVPLQLTDPVSIHSLIKYERPDYFINFGAQTFVADSWKNPIEHLQTNAIAVACILEAIKDFCPNCRFYSSGSSEQWGDIAYSPQDEKHPMRPRSVYGVSKCAASLLCKVYRESYNLYAVHGLLTNHESEIRQEYFVTRKISKNVARISNTLELFSKGVEGISPKELFFEPLRLGNVNALRDFSHAFDFIDGIWRMLNQEKYREDLKDVDELDLPKYIKEYVLSSGETHSVREFVEEAFKAAGIEGYWKGEGINEKFYLANYLLEYIPFLKSPILVEIDPQFFRPADVELLLGDSSLARKELGWSPKVTFKELVKIMVKSDIQNYEYNQKNLS